MSDVTMRGTGARVHVSECPPTLTQWVLATEQGVGVACSWHYWDGWCKGRGWDEVLVVRHGSRETRYACPP